MTAIEHLKAKPIAGSVVVGLFASLCCGGSLIFASIGLGVFYSTLGLSRFIPQALAAGAVSIGAINYVYYRQMVKKGTAKPVALRQKMFISTAIGLAVMAGSFVFMEWLNHAVVHGDRFLARPEYSQALIKGVPNTTLLYVCATFFCARAAVGIAISTTRFFRHARWRWHGKGRARCHLWGNDSPARWCGGRCFEQGIRNCEWSARACSLGC
jgi:hypothetical protein